MAVLPKSTNKIREVSPYFLVASTIDCRQYRTKCQ